LPITSNVDRRLPSEVRLEAGVLSSTSAAQCHLCTVVAVEHVSDEVYGNVGPVLLTQVRSVIADLLDIP
jgi:hypothetical protein